MSVSPQALERSVLERKERDELAAIAEAMGVKANSRTSKANLIEGILREAGVETADEKPKRARTTKAEANGGEKAEREEKAESAGKAEAAEPASVEEASQTESAPVSEESADQAAAA